MCCSSCGQIFNSFPTHTLVGSLLLFSVSLSQRSKWLLASASNLNDWQTIESNGGQLNPVGSFPTVTANSPTSHDPWVQSLFVEMKDGDRHTDCCVFFCYLCPCLCVCVSVMKSNTPGHARVSSCLAASQLGCCFSLKLIKHMCSELKLLFFRALWKHIHNFFLPLL